MKKLSKASTVFGGVSVGTFAVSAPSSNLFSTSTFEMVEQSLVYKIKEGRLAEEVVVGAYNLVLDLKEGLPDAAFDSIKSLATRHIKEGTFEEGVEELKGLLVVLKSNYS